MTNYKLKFVKSAAALALGASVITSAVVAADTTASAKTTYKVSNGKLVNAKTKKAIKGYKSYKSELYKDGKKFTGTYKGKYYKSGKLFTGLVSKTYYKNGVKATATYKGVYYKAGKAFTGITSYGNYYENGVKFTGKKGQVYYKNGKKFTGTTSYGNYYVNGLRANGIYTINGVNVQYKDGKVVVDKTAPVITLEEGAKTSYTVKNGEAFTAPKATAKDNLDKTVKVVSSITDAEGKAVEKIDTTVAGTYTITYTAKDLASNKATAVQVSVVVEEAAPAVKSVKALSATKVQVEFTQAVDALEAVKDGVVKIEGVTLTKPTLSEDGKTLTFTTDNAIDVTNATVVVIPVPTKADAKVSTPKYTSLLTFKDTVAPEIKGTEQLSAKKVKVSFSEPLSTQGTITFKDAKGNDVTSNVDYAFSKGDDTITLDLSKLADDTTVTATVVGAQDMAGNLLTPNPASFTATKQKVDGVLPTVSSIEQTGAKTFKVTFSKAVTAGTVTVNGTATTVAPATEGATTDKVYTVTTASNLKGLTNVALTGFADNDDQKLADVTKVVTFTEDTVAPKVTDSKVVTLDNAEYLQLTFDKAVSVTTGAEFNVTGKYVKDYVTTTLAAKDVEATHPTKDGKVTDNKVLLVKVSDFTNVKGAAHEVTLTPANNAILSDSDVALTDAVKASFTPAGDVEVTPINENVFTSSDIEVVQDANPSYVNVTFKGNEVDGASAANKANYSIGGATVESVIVKAYDTAAKTQVVTLKLEDGSNIFNGVRNISVSNVKVKGSTKVMNSVSFNNVSLNENVAAKLSSSKLTANDTITLTFNENVKAADLKLTSGTTPVAVAQDGVVVSGNTVTIKLAAALDSKLLSNLVVNGTVQDSVDNTTTLTNAPVAQ